LHSMTLVVLPVTQDNSMKTSASTTISSRLLFCVLATTVFLGGCANNYGQTYAEQSRTRSEIPPHSFRVTFFRLDDSLRSNRSARVRIDDDRKFYVHHQSFASVDLTAGKHVIRTDMIEAPFTAVCKYEISPSAGEHWYYLIRPTPAPAFGATFGLLPLTIFALADAYARGGGCSGDFFALRINPSEAEPKILGLREALD